MTTWQIITIAPLVATALILLARPLRVRWRALHLSNSKLAASEAQLRMVLASSGCELWRFNVVEQQIDRENVLSHASERGLGASVRSEDLIAAIHPQDRMLFGDAMRAHVRGLTESFQAVYRMTSLNGEYIWLRSNGQIQRKDANGRVRVVSGTTVEVTHLKEKEQALEAANSSLNAQIEELKAARAHIVETEKRRKLALWGSGCEFFEANLLTEMITRENKTPGLAVNDLGDSTQEYWSYLHPDDIESYRAAFLAHLTGKTDFYDVSYRARRSDGGWCWVQTRGRGVAWDAEGRVTIISGTNYDISVLKNAETGLKHAAEELERRVESRTAALTRAISELRAAQSQLVNSEKMAALGNLVAGVAHEINTPLGISVTAASHLGEISQRLSKQLANGQLKKSELDAFAEQSQSAVELVMTNLRRASELVKSFKQVAVDQSSEQRRVIELKPYLQEILNSLRPSTKRFPQAIMIDAQEGIHWDCYPGALYQITSNLVLNALNHAFAADIPPVVSPTTGLPEIGAIKITAWAGANEISLSISDNGCGMDADTAKRIFEPFFTTKRGLGGSGLGLHIVFNLVNTVFGGTISVETSPGKGSRFLIRVRAV